jgi:hypothetical protein
MRDNCGLLSRGIKDEEAQTVHDRFGDRLRRIC